MDVLFFGLMALALFVIVGVLLVPAGFGVYFLCIAAWRRFTFWAAAGHVAEERKRASARSKREKRIASEREVAMLNGASTVATKLVRTVVKSQLQHLASREADHQQQVIQLALLLACNQNLPRALVDDELNPSCEPMEALTMVAPTDRQPQANATLPI